MRIEETCLVQCLGHSRYTVIVSLVCSGVFWVLGGFFFLVVVFFFLVLCVCVCFLGLHLRHIEVPRLGVELELQLPAYTTATASPDPSHIYNLHHRSLQHRIPDPLNEARDWTHVLMDSFPLHHSGVLSPFNDNFTSLSSGQCDIT